MVSPRDQLDDFISTRKKWEEHFHDIFFFFLQPRADRCWHIFVHCLIFRVERHPLNNIRGFSKEFFFSSLKSSIYRRRWKKKIVRIRCSFSWFSKPLENSAIFLYIQRRYRIGDNQIVEEIGYFSKLPIRPCPCYVAHCSLGRKVISFRDPSNPTWIKEEDTAFEWERERLLHIRQTDQVLKKELMWFCTVNTN